MSTDCRIFVLSNAVMKVSGWCRSVSVSGCVHVTRNKNELSYCALRFNTMSLNLVKGVRDDT